MSAQPAVGEEPTGPTPAQVTRHEVAGAMESRQVEGQQTTSADDELDPGKSFLVALGLSILVWASAIMLLFLV